MHEDFHQVEVGVRKNLQIGTAFKLDAKFQVFEKLEVGVQFISDAEFQNF